MINSPRISIVMPVYNEQAILANALDSLIKCLAGTAYRSDYELVICENGSTDRTLEIAQEFAHGHDRVRVDQLPVPSYWHALRHGILTANGDIIVIFNADFWDIDFMQRAVERCADYDMVIGSKLARGAHDNRPILRRLISRAFNSLLQTAFGYAGTDTHGLKALKKQSVAPIAAACRTTNDVFDSELILRAQRAGLLLCEIPVRVEEHRPARTGLLRRAPRTARDLWTIWRTLR